MYRHSRILNSMKVFRYNQDSKLASIATEVKVVWAVGISIGILLSYAGVVQLVLVSILLSATIYTGVRLPDLADYLKLFLPIFVIIFLLHLFYHQGTTILQIWFLKATDRGLQAGLFNLLRFINFILVAICFFSSTSAVEFAQSIMKSGKLASVFGLVKKRFIQDVALTFFIALRFMPVLARETNTVRMAMVARGADFKHGFINRMKTNFKLILPLFSRVLRQSDDVAAALSLKSNKGEYFVIDKKSLKRRDILLILTALILMCIMVLL